MKYLILAAALAASITPATAQESKFGKIVDNGYEKWGFDLQGHVRVKWVYIPGNPAIPNAPPVLIYTYLWDADGQSMGTIVGGGEEGKACK